MEHLSNQMCDGIGIRPLLTDKAVGDGAGLDHAVILRLLDNAVDVAAGLPVAVGGQPPGAGGRNFDGLVDDVRIYERPLDDAEIEALATPA